MDPNAPQPQPLPQAPPPDLGAPQQPNVQQAPAPPPGPTPQQADLAHSALLGHGFKSLLSSMGGTTTTYQQGPNGPVPVQSKTGAGGFFRNILAGALAGSVAGSQESDHAGSGWAAAGAGAGAATRQAAQQQAQAQQNAQQQWQNKLTAQKADQEATAADTENQVRKAQIAQANAETLRTNMLTQGSSYDLHQKVADADKARVSTYEDAGVKPLFDDVTESQMQDIFKNRPGASTLDWRHTGVKTVVGPDGTPTYEYTLSAYDPKTPMPISKATVDQWDKDGLFKYHPEYKDVAQPGKTLTVGQFTALDKQAQNLSGQQTARTMQDLGVQHLQAQIGEAKALIAEHQAATRNSNLSAQEKQTEMTQKKDTETAWDNLAKAGNDPTKLNSHDRVSLARVAQPAMAESLAGIKEAAAAAQNGDEDAKASLPGLWSNYNSLQKLASLAPPSATASAGGSVPAGAEVIVNPTTGEKMYSTDGRKTWNKVGSAPATPENPLTSLAKGLTLVKGPNGESTPLADSSVKNFLSLHPEYKVVGKGQSSPTSSPDEQVGTFSAPNGATVTR